MFVDETLNGTQSRRAANKPTDETTAAAAAAEVPFPPRLRHGRRRRRRTRFAPDGWGRWMPAEEADEDSFIAHRTEQHARAVATEGAPYPKHSERAEGSPLKAGRRLARARPGVRGRHNDEAKPEAASRRLSFFFF